MSTGAKIFVACLAIVGGIIAIKFLISIFYVLLFAAAVLGIGYVVVKLATSNRKSLAGNRKSLR